MFTTASGTRSEYQPQLSDASHPRAQKTSQPSGNPIWQQLAMRAQTKRTISGAADAHELEADRAADQAIGSSSAAVSSSPAGSGHARERVNGGQPIPAPTRVFLNRGLAMTSAVCDCTQTTRLTRPRSRSAHAPSRWARTSPLIRIGSRPPGLKISTCSHTNWRT